MIRFTPFTVGKDRLEVNRVYLTTTGAEIGPFEETTFFAYGKDGEPDTETFDVILDEPTDPETDWACWWDTGVPANPNAEHLGEITAVEIKEIK